MVNPKCTEKEKENYYFKNMEKYFETNKQSWNKRTDIHLESDFYDNENFIKGKSSLNAIELDLLGDISGKKILHLQCHFGQDTISLNKLGAEVTGVDLSDNAISKANELAQKTNAKAKFICCNIYDLPNHLNEEFDLIFTSYGTIVWLPDLNEWASIISKFLKPGGQLVFVDFHPVVWMFDDDFTHIKYNYFNNGEIVETDEGTYTDGENQPKLESITWNHSLSETTNALINSGLTIKSFNEYDYSPYDCFNNTVKIEERKYRIKGIDEKMPMVFSIVASK